MAGPEGTAPLQLLVGLGNPGDKYAGTRHNVGFMALEQLARRDGGSFKQQAKLQGLLAEVGQGDRRLRLLMPQTYMNESGRSIRAALDWFGFSPEQMLVLVDDMDLPLGRLRLRLSGGAGGHNGLRSTISHLGGAGVPPVADWDRRSGLESCGAQAAHRGACARSFLRGGAARTAGGVG